MGKSSSLSIVAVVVLTFFLSACSHTSSMTAPLATEQRTVARVNGEEITAGELQRAEKILLGRKPGLQIPPNLQKEFETQALNQLISAELLFQASRKLEMKNLDSQAEAKLAETKSRFRKAGDFEKGLKEIGLDEVSFLRAIRRELAIAHLVDTEIAKDIKVTDEEIATFYQQNHDKFDVPERVRASHILIGADKKSGPEEKKAAREKAEKLHEKLVKGADFATLAKENSTCPSSKEGGDLGFFSKGTLDPDFEKAAFALEGGSLSGVVESRYGYHLIKITDRKKAEEIPLTAARGKIADYLKAQKTKMTVDAFVGKARSSAKIEVQL